MSAPYHLIPPYKMPTRFSGCLAAVLCVATLTACGASVQPVLPDAGQYTLTAVNDTALPYRYFQNATNALFLDSDQIRISEIGTWTETGSQRLIANGQTTVEPTADNGTWVRSGASLILLSGNHTDTAYTGSASARQLSLTRGALRFTYTLAP